MIKLKFTLLTLLTLTVLNAQSQTIRVVGYAGELVFIDDSILPIPVDGATQEECDDNFADLIDHYGVEAFYYGRSGTQPCVPIVIYRSATAPATSLSPAVTLWPEMPLPPECLSCPLFDHPLIIKGLYPDHVSEVNGIVQQFKIDQYNQDLKALQNQYKGYLTGFEKAMFELDEELANKDK